MGDGSKLCLVMSVESIQDTKELPKNGLNNNAEDMCMYTPTLNTPCVDEPRTTQTSSTLSSSRRKSESQERGRRLESINEDSECFTSVIRSASTSTMSFSPPFPGFQVPEATVVLNNVHERKSRGNVNLSFREAIPIMPTAIAIICLIFNIVIPGTGTIISGFVAFCLSEEEPMYDKMAVLCINCFVGLAQLATVVFMMIGWIWSITWGCAFVGLSTKYRSKRKQHSRQLEVSTS
ncbi:uncharacterized protein LOC116300534 [Actinia tenebrosa]|uniref:Uncharacterized protein LOC116300534 n=1 Tax=Actinia tenebrosa TaxID=6105 RepID=A0A6P8ICH5_ACTTE|nr:uncharacterized protein LOC116300534 [Actinia tenebrosa]